MDNVMFSKFNNPEFCKKFMDAFQHKFLETVDEQVDDRLDAYETTRSTAYVNVAEDIIQRLPSNLQDFAEIICNDLLNYRISQSNTIAHEVGYVD